MYFNFGFFCYIDFRRESPGFRYVKSLGSCHLYSVWYYNSVLQAASKGWSEILETHKQHHSQFKTQLLWKPQGRTCNPKPFSLLLEGGEAWAPDEADVESPTPCNCDSSLYHNLPSTSYYLKNLDFLSLHVWEKKQIHFQYQNLQVPWSASPSFLNRFTLFLKVFLWLPVLIWPGSFQAICAVVFLGFLFLAGLGYLFLFLNPMSSSSFDSF